MIRITANIALDEKEIKLKYIHASGPGGQNVNKVSSAVQLYFDVQHSPSLPEDVRRRLARRAGKRLTKDGILVLKARSFRNQESNRRDAVLRLVRLIREAAVKPKIRRRSKPTQAARRRRMDSKRKHSTIKRLRRPVTNSDE